MAKPTKIVTEPERSAQRLRARRNRALRRFDRAWRDAAKRSCTEEDAEIAYLLASDDPPNPVDPKDPIPPDDDEEEDEEGEETETTRSVAFSLRRSEKRVTKCDGETTVKIRECSTEVMHSSSDDPPNPVGDPDDPIPPDPPEELRRLASEKPESAHGTFLRRREEICRRYDRRIEQLGGNQS